MTDFQTWWDSQPRITKWLGALTLAITVLANFDLLNPYNLVLIPSSIYKDFQIWRIATCFLYQGKLGFPFLIDLIMLFQHSSQLENLIFEGRTADYFHMLSLCSLLLLGVGSYFGFVILGHALLFSIIYYWSKKFPEKPTGLFFITFKGMYLPWALVAFHILLSGSIPIIELVGIVAGHIYHFFADLYPPGRWLVQTPGFIQSLFPPAANRYIHGFAPARPMDGAPAPEAVGQPQRHNWGQGRALGTR